METLSSAVETNGTFPISEGALKSVKVNCPFIFHDGNLDDAVLLLACHESGLPYSPRPVSLSAEKYSSYYPEGMSAAVPAPKTFQCHSRDQVDLEIFSKVHLPRYDPTVVQKWLSSKSDESIPAARDFILSAPVDLNDVNPTNGSNCFVIGAGGYNTAESTMGGVAFDSTESMIHALQCKFRAVGGNVIVVNSVASRFDVPTGKGDPCNITKMPSRLLRDDVVRDWYCRTIAPVSASFFVWVRDVCSSLMLKDSSVAESNVSEIDVMAFLEREMVVVVKGFDILRTFTEENFSEMTKHMSEDMVKDVRYLWSTLDTRLHDQPSGKWKEYLAFIEDPSAEITDGVGAELILSPSLSEMVPYSFVCNGRFPSAATAAAVSGGTDGADPEKLVEKNGYLLRLRPGAAATEHFVGRVVDLIGAWYRHSAEYN